MDPERVAPLGALSLTALAAVPQGTLDTRTPTATVVATDLAPPQPHLLEGVRTLVLQALALFGYTPGTPTPNPFLAAIWGLYRRVESTLDNQRPTVGAASVSDTGVDSDAHVVVTGTVSFADEDGDPLSYTATNGAHGSVAVNPDGSFTYTSTDAGYTGPDTFTITADDAGLHLHGLVTPLGAGHTTTATVALSVTAPPNVAPVATDDVVRTNEDTPLTIVPTTLLGNDSDLDGDALVITAAGTPTHGTTALGGDGTITYTPAANYHGNDAFSYTVSDGALNATATVTVTVAAVNDAPVIGTVTSTPGIGNTWEVTPTVSDPDGDTVTVTVGSVDAAHVTVTPGTGGRYTVTVTDPAWAKSNPGAQISVLVTATDGASEPVTKTLAIGTVNNTTAVGNNAAGQLNIPALPAGVTYTQVDAAESFTVLLRSDGTAVAVGSNFSGQLNIPTLPAGVTYTQISAGSTHTVLLRSDGTAVAVGSNSFGQLNIPTLPAGVTYTQVSAGSVNTVLLRSDGTAVAVGNNSFGQNVIPALPPGMTYTKVSSGSYYTVLLRSDGTAVGVGTNRSGESSVPVLPAGVTYTRVSTATELTQYVRSDGTAIASGSSAQGEVDVPTLPPGVTYTQVSSGSYHTVWLRSDGTVAVRGSNDQGQTTIPALPAGVSYAQAAAGGNDTVLLTVVDAPPVAGDDVVGTAANAVLLMNPNTLLHNDSDPDGDPLTVTAVWGAGHGLTALGADGTITYTPSAGYYGVDHFNYLASDGVLGDAATVTVTVTPVNGAPVANGDVATVAEGGTTTIVLTGNDTDADGTVDESTVVIVRQPTAGTVTVNPNGTVTYASNGAEVTSDNFTYTVKDDAGLTSNAATVTVTITPVNDPPVANGDVATVAEGGTTTIVLTGNDTDADGTVDESTVVIVRQPTAGTVTVNPNGTVTYASNGAEVTSDNFTYTVKDDAGLTSNAATVTVTITPVNDPPVTTPDTYTVAKGGTLTVAAPGVLGNDSDVDGPNLFIIDGTGVTHGSLELLSDGSFTYIPAAYYVGSDSFTYQVTDGIAVSAPVTVSITVTGVNEPPVGNEDFYSLAEDGTLTIGAPGVLANDTDADSPDLFVSAATGTAFGGLEVRSDGSFTYTPAANYNGADSFTYQVSDGSTSSAPVTVTISISSVNDAPVVADDTIPFPKNGFIGFSLANRSSDADGDTLVGTLITGTQHGKLFFDGNQLAFSYMPTKDFTGEDSFTYKVNDGTVDSNVATVKLVVT
ncbi:Ig-like domain-containing protein [Mycolicibacterium hodleri]